MVREYCVVCPGPGALPSIARSAPFLVSLAVGRSSDSIDSITYSVVVDVSKIKSLLLGLFLDKGLSLLFDERYG